MTNSHSSRSKLYNINYVQQNQFQKINYKNNCAHLPRRMWTCVKRNNTIIQVELTFRKESIIWSNSNDSSNKILNLGLDTLEFCLKPI